MEENKLNNSELPQEIQADNDNTNPLLDIIATLQEKLDNNQNISNNSINTSSSTYSNTHANSFSQNINSQEINDSMNGNYTQNKNINGNNSNASFDISKLFEMLNGFSGNSQQYSTSNSSASNPFMNIDMDTMMRVGKIFSSMNKEDPRKNLLLSLKPFLRDNRQRNVDTYIFILGILNVIDSFSNGDSGF